LDFVFFNPFPDLIPHLQFQLGWKPWRRHCSTSRGMAGTNVETSEIVGAESWKAVAKLYNII
jgi:hypothetical protein